MSGFLQAFEVWLSTEIAAEVNPRRRELLEKGLGHGTVEFLRQIWFPAVRNFHHLHPEWELRDYIMVTATLIWHISQEAA